MSREAVGWVLEHSTTRGTERLVLLVMAEAANADGSGCMLGPTAIARRAGLETPEWAKKVVRRLVKGGHLQPGALSGKYGTRTYAIAGVVASTPGSIRPGSDSTPGSHRPGRQGRIGTPKGADPTPYPTTTQLQNQDARPRSPFAHFDEVMR
jgi:hypothetical protein